MSGVPFSVPSDLFISLPYRAEVHVFRLLVVEVVQNHSLYFLAEDEVNYSDLAVDSSLLEPDLAVLLQLARVEAVGLNRQYLHCVLFFVNHMADIRKGVAGSLAAISAHHPVVALLLLFSTGLEILNNQNRALRLGRYMTHSRPHHSRVAKLGALTPSAPCVRGTHTLSKKLYEKSQC